MRLGLVAGTGFYDFLDDPETVTVETPYGSVEVATGQIPGLDGQVFFLNRHGGGHRVPPHRIDHRRTIDALARCRVDRVVAVHNVGALRPGLTTGHFVVPHDFVDLTGRDDGTFHDEEVVHIDLSEPYCPTVRGALVDAARRHLDADRVHDRGVYVATRGPRFETPAEVNHLATLGDVVGMTGCPEAALARERGLCYASLSFVANPAAGIAGHIAADTVRAALAAESGRVRAVLGDALRALPRKRACRCADAARMGRITMHASGATA